MTCEGPHNAEPRTRSYTEGLTNPSAVDVYRRLGDLFGNHDPSYVFGELGSSGAGEFERAAVHLHLKAYAHRREEIEAASETVSWDDRRASAEAERYATESTANMLLARKFGVNYDEARDHLTEHGSLPETDYRGPNKRRSTRRQRRSHAIEVARMEAME